MVMSAETLSPEEEQVLSAIRRLAATIKERPEESSVVFSRLPEDSLAREIIEAATEDLRGLSSHLPDFFGKYLDDLPPSPKLLFLGFGEGSELLHARTSYPDSLLLGVDKSVGEMGVLSALMADAVWLEEDLGKKSPDEILRTFGTMPDAVIARHPSNGPDPIMNHVLSEWGNLMSMAGRPMLISTYTQYERYLVTDSLLCANVLPLLSEYTGGSPANIDFLDGSNGNVPQDRYVLQITSASSRHLM